MADSTPSPIYLGSIGYNESPEALGEPGGFWMFENYGAMWEAFAISESLNDAFVQLGEPTYSAILTAKDEAGHPRFHLLVLSVQPIYPRKDALLAEAQAWLLQQGLARRESDEKIKTPHDREFKRDGSES
jgi:hypothetical protein